MPQHKSPIAEFLGVCHEAYDNRLDDLMPKSRHLGYEPPSSIVGTDECLSSKPALDSTCDVGFVDKRQEMRPGIAVYKDGDGGAV